MGYLLLLVGLISGALISFFLTQRGHRQKYQEDSKTIDAFKIEVATMNNSSARLREDLLENKSELGNVRAGHQAELKNAIEWKSKFNALEEKIATQKDELASLQEKFTKEFELVAAKILA